MGSQTVTGSVSIDGVQKFSFSSSGSQGDATTGPCRDVLNSITEFKATVNTFLTDEIERDGKGDINDQFFGEQAVSDDEDGSGQKKKKRKNK